jgi:hypothetical protein
MVVAIKVEDLIRDVKTFLKGQKRLVRLILEEGFDISIKRHPLEKFLAREGIPYYFFGDKIGKKEDYEIDLTKIKIIYHL